MNPKWSKLQEEFLALSLPPKIAEFTFLPPNQYRIERYMGKEIMVVAEDRWITPSGESGICLVVTPSGKVYVADLLTYKTNEYCSASFKQFVAIANKYFFMSQDLLSHDVDGTDELHNLEAQEKKFRGFIQQIDSTALSDANNFWSTFAEEIGYGFN